MRSLQECQAEIFRRSEKRIKERRKHILMSCIPLVLCASLLAAAFHNPGPSKSTAPDVVQSAMGAVSAGGISECKVTRISVSGSELTLTFTEPGQILPILELLDSCTDTALENKAPAGEQTRGENPTLNEDGSGRAKSEAVLSDSANVGVTVTLTPREGNEQEYLLAGNRLEDLAAGTVYALPQDLAKELHTLLGISQP